MTFGLPPSVCESGRRYVLSVSAAAFCLIDFGMLLRLQSTTSEMSKKNPTSIRLSPEMKSAADKLAALQNRSLSNLIETLLQEAFQKHGIKTESRVRG